MTGIVNTRRIREIEMFTQWYKGNAVSSAPPATTLIMTIGSISTSTLGTMYGYAQNARYFAANDSGASTFQYLRDIRDPANPKTVRFAGLFYQQNAYLVLGWEPVAMAPTADMLPFTNKLKINGGATYDFTSAATAGFTTPNVGKYLSVGAGAFNWQSVIGGTVNLEFV